MTSILVRIKQQDQQLLIRNKSLNIIILISHIFFTQSMNRTNSPNLTITCKDDCPHIKDPRGFKNLIRLNQHQLFQNEYFKKVYDDLVHCSDISIALNLCYSLKYAYDWGLFELPQNQLKNDSLAYILIQRVFSLENKNEKNLSPLLKSGSELNPISKKGSVQITLEKQMNIDSVFNEREQNALITIKCIQQIIKDQNVDEDEENQSHTQNNTFNGYKGNFYWFNSYFKVFEQYLTKSSSQIIHSQEINGDIYRWLAWKMYQKGLSLVSFCLFDNIMLKSLCLQIIHNQIFIHSCLIQDKIFLQLLEIIIQSRNDYYKCLQKKFQRDTFTYNLQYNLQTPVNLLDGWYFPTKNSLDYYISTNLYSKIQANTLAKSIKDNCLRLDQKYNKGWWVALNVDQMRQKRHQKLTFFQNQLLKFISKLQLKAAQIVSRLVEMKKKTIKNLITTTTTLQRLQGLPDELKKKLWYIYALFSKPIRDQKVFVDQYNISLSTSTDNKAKRQAQQARNYTLAVLANLELTNQFFTQSFISKMVQNLENQQNYSKQILKTYLQVIIKNYSNLNTILLKIITSKYFIVSKVKQAILEQLLYKLVQLSNSQPILINFFSHFVQIQLKKNEEQKMGFWLFLIQILFSRFQQNICLYLQKYISYWKKCILSSSKLARQNSKSLLITYDKVQDIESIDYSFLTSQILKQHKNKIPYELLVYYMDKYQFLNPYTRSNSLEIIAQISERINNSTKIGQSLDKIMILIQFEEEFAKNIKLKQIFYTIYQKMQDQSLKTKYYCRVIEFIGFYQPKSQNNKSKSLDLSKRILSLIPAQKTNNQQFELRVINKILHHQNLNDLHEQAFKKSCSKLKHQIKAPIDLIDIMQEYILKKIKENSSMANADTKTIFSLAIPLSKSFIKSCFTHFRRLNQKQYYQFLDMILDDSQQQLQNALFNLTQQRQIVIRDSKNNHNDLLKKVELISSQMSLLDESFVIFVFKLVKHIFNAKKQAIIWKILQTIEENKDTHLYQLIQEQIVILIEQSITEDKDRLFNFLTSKSQIMDKLSQKMINYTIKQFNNNKSSSFTFLIAQILLKHPKIQYNFSQICSRFQHFINEPRSNQFTRALVNLVKHQPMCFKNQEEGILKLRAYLKAAINIQRPQSLISFLELYQLVWHQVSDLEYFIIKLLVMIKIFSKNCLVRQRYRKFVENKEIQQKIENIQFSEQWQNIKFQLLNEADKKKFAMDKVKKKNKDARIYIPYLSKFLQDQLLEYQQLNIVLDDLKKISTDSSLRINILIKNILKYQVIYLIMEEQKFHSIINFFDLAVYNMELIKKSKSLNDLFEKFVVKCCISSFHIRQRLPGQLYYILGPLNSVQALENYNKQTSIVQRINCLTNFIGHYSFMLIDYSKEIQQIIIKLLIDCRDSASKKNISNQLIESLVQSILRIPFFDKNNSNLIFLTSLLLNHEFRNRNLLTYYHLCSILYQIQIQPVLIKNLLKNPCEQALMIVSQLLKVSSYDNQKLSEEQQQMVMILNKLTEMQDMKISNLAWKCIFSICQNNQQAYFRFYPQIHSFKDNIKNKNISFVVNNLIILSSCDHLPNCKTVTQILLMNYFQKLKIRLKNNQKINAYQLETSLQNLRLQSDFLIMREKSHIKQLLNENEYFIKSLQKLFAREYLVPDDLIFILQCAKQDFYKTVEQLALYGQNIIMFILQRYLEQKNIFLLDNVSFWKHFSFRNALAIVQVITSQKDLEQIQKIALFTKSYHEIYATDLYCESFEELREYLLIESLMVHFQVCYDKQKLRNLTKRLIKESLKSQIFFQQLYKKIQQIFTDESANPHFIGSLQTFCDYIVYKNQINLSNLEMLRESPEIINLNYIKSVGRSHEKNIRQIIDELKDSCQLSEKQINGLQQFLQRFQEISNQQNNMKGNTFINFQLFKKQQNEPSTQSLQTRHKIYQKSKEKLTFRSSEFFEFPNFTLLSQIVYYDKKVRQCQGIQKNLRKTQIAAIWIGLNSIINHKQSNILQVSTGEGKSLIIVGIASILARHNKCSVDIITSSPVLASRDSQEFQKLFEEMGISSDCNIQKIPYQQGQKNCYKYQVVYGTCNQFSFDWLRHNYSRLNTKGKRVETNSYLIIDQADSCMLDDMFYVARLADSFPGSQCLLPLYFHIWNTFREVTKRLIQIQDKLYSVRGQINISEDNTISLAYLQNSQKGQIFIPDLMKHIKGQFSQGKKAKQLPFILEEIEARQHLDYVKTQMEHNINQMLNKKQFSFVWSKYARNYAKKRVKTWAESLIIAERMTENVDYIVTKSKTIKLVDYMKTGVVQNNTSLSNAVHQFLQCKHRCPITLQTRTTNYLSYYSLFKMYQNRIIGLTGTVGGSKSKQMFQKNYHCKCSIIPKFRKDMMFKLPSIDFIDSQQWINRIVEKAILQAKKGRAVLIVSLSIRTSNKITKKLQQHYKKELITKYLSNDSKGQGGDDEPKTCKMGEIIVGTNLVARGTDIKTEESVQFYGGLHIILTYIPDSQRVQMQIMGRTCRNGKLGSFQRISLTNLQNNKNNQESQQILQKMIVEINIKDELFQRYNKWLWSVRQNESLSKINRQFIYKKTLSEVVISQIEDRFSELLTQIEHQFQQNVSINNIKQKGELQLKYIQQAYKLYTKDNKGRLEFLRNGCYVMKLANSFIQSWTVFDYSQQLKEVLEYAKLIDPQNFNVYYLMAYYNLNGKKCWFTKNQHQKDYKQESSMLLKQSKQFLLEEMSGYESVTQYLIYLNQQNSKMYKQFQKKLEICAQCLQSITRMENTINLSYYPLDLKINKILQKRQIQQIRHSVKRSSIEEILKKEFNKIQLKCLKINSVVLASFIQKAGQDISLNIEGQLSQLIKAIQALIQISEKIQYKAGKLKIQKIPTSSLRQLAQSFKNMRQPLRNTFEIDLQFCGKKALKIQNLIQIKARKNCHTFFRGEDQFFILSIEDPDYFFQIIQSFQQDSFATITHYQRNKLEYFKDILQQHSNLKMIQCFSIEIEDVDFKKDQTIKKYEDCFKSYGLQTKATIKCKTSKQGCQSFRILNSLFQQAQKNVDIGKIKKLSEIYPKMDSPLLQIAHMYNRGFQLIFQAQDRKPFPYKAVICLSSVAATQIVLGSLLMMTGVGFSVGSAVIAESVNEIFAIIDVCRTNQFSWSNYLIGKAISVSLTVITLGIGGLKNAAKGVAEVIQVVGKEGLKQLCEGSGKQMMLLIGKSLIKQVGEQGITRLAGEGLRNISDFLIQQFENSVQTQVSNVFDNNDDKALIQLKKLKYLQSIQLGTGDNQTNMFTLSSQIKKILMPQQKCPVISQIVSGLKLIAQKVIYKYKGCGDFLNIATQITNIISFINILKSPLNQQIVRMKKLLSSKIVYVPYPQQAIKRYLLINNIDQKQLSQIMEEVYNNNNRKNQELQKIAQNSQNWYQQVFKNIFSQEFLQANNKQIENFTNQKLNTRLERDINNIAQWDFQIIKKILVDFVITQIKKNVNQKCINTYVIPLMNKMLAPVTKKMLNKVLASKNDHNEHDKRRYEKLKQNKNQTQGDKQFIKDFENPDIDKQLNTHCRYRSQNLTEKFKGIVINKQGQRGELTESQQQVIKKKISVLEKNIDYSFSQTDLKLIAKKLGLKVIITKDPNKRLTPDQVSNGVKLILYEQGNFDNKGNMNIGHYKIFDPNENNFIDVAQESAYSCGADVLKLVANQSGFNISNNQQLKNILLQQIKLQPQKYIKCKEADQFMCIQYPKYTNSVMKVGGLNRKKLQQIINLYYPPGKKTGYGYNSQIFQGNNLDKIKKLYRQMPLNNFIQQMLKNQIQNERLFAFPIQFFEQMNDEEKRSFIEKQLRQIQEICWLQKNIQNIYSDINNQNYLRYQKLCVNTFNGCCRHQNVSLDYLINYDQKFIQCMDQGDKVSFVLSSGHTYMIIQDINSKAIFTFDQTVRSQREDPHSEINSLSQYLYQQLKKVSEDKYVEKLLQISGLNNPDLIKKVVKIHSGDPAAIAQKISYISIVARDPSQVLERCKPSIYSWKQKGKQKK